MDQAKSDNRYKLVESRMRILVAMLILSICAVHASADKMTSITIASKVETVFSWNSQRCDDLTIPDAPARAYRRGDGTVILVAAHYNNIIFEGRDFKHLKLKCAVQSRGHEDPDPASFDDRFWIEALLPGNDGNLIGIVSHEYMGSRHPGQCSSDKPYKCWYSSLLFAEADEYKLSFKLLPGDSRTLATPPHKYDPHATTRVGFFTTSNIVRQGEYYYLFSWVELPGLQGNCLFRTSVSSPIEGWAAFHNGRYETRFSNPYSNKEIPSSCDIIGKHNLTNVLRSLVWDKYINKWIGVYIVADGIVYSTSDNLLDWSPPALLMKADGMPNSKGCKAVYQYPSLIDHGSISNIFDAGGENLYLYLTRFNQDSCQFGLDRDLVRVPLRVTENLTSKVTSQP
jgi:hypothetical protein